jgi:Na+/melibiose symporter-like transporter
MNTCATLFENRKNLRIMSTCHGLWSSGAMAGSAMSGTATGLGVVPWLWMGLVGTSVLLVAWYLRGQLTYLDERGQQRATEGQGQKFAWPSRLLWLIISVSLCTNITEGTMADWAAIFMRDVVRSDAYTLGWGFAAYAFFMAAGRFLGDGLLARFKQSSVLSVGGLVAAAGLLLLAAFPSMPLVLLWFSMIGAGVSLGAPILYAAAARAPGMARGAGLATMNTFAMFGFFGGPVLIGFMAKIWSLPLAFAVVGVAALWWAWGGTRLQAES